MGVPSCAGALKDYPESARVSGQYAHHREGCETVDSVCRLCGLVVGRAYREASLFQLELRHVCQPAERRQATRIAYQIFNPATT